MKHEGKIKKEEIQSFLASHALPADKKEDDPLLAQKLPSLVQALTAETFSEKVKDEEDRNEEKEEIEEKRCGEGAGREYPSE
eukprot:752700-Hanusia_phi.AAC.2